MRLLMILLVSVCYSKIVVTANLKKDLHFSFITALSGGSTSSGGIPIIDYALEQINNDSRVLPEYNLQYTTVLDSKVKKNIMLCAYHYIGELLSFALSFAVQKHLCS